MEISIDELNSAYFFHNSKVNGIESVTTSDKSQEAFRFKRMIYEESQNYDEEFYSLSHDSRLTMLRAQKTKKRAAQEELKKLTKKSSKLQQRTANAPRFPTIASVRSEWKAISEPSPQITKENSIKMNVEVLRESACNSLIPQKYVNSKPSKPLNLPINFKNVMGDDVLEDVELKKAFKSEKTPEGEICVAMNAHFYSMMASISQREFPFNLNFEKRENKVTFLPLLEKENPFTSLIAYNENAKDLPENEDEILVSSENATIVQRNLQALGGEAEDTTEKNYKVVKVELDSKIKIYTRVKIDAVTNNGEPIFVRCIYENAGNWKGNFLQRENEIITGSWMNNGAVLQGLIAQGQVAGVQRVVVAFVEGNNNAETFDLFKLERKSTEDFKSMMNIGEEDCINNIRNCLSPIINLPNGNYVLHKPEGRAPLSIYQTQENQAE